MRLVVCFVFKDNVCLYQNVPLTLKRLAVPFGTNPTRILHIGATVSYNGQPQPQFEPAEQSVFVVGNRRHDSFGCNVRNWTLLVGFFMQLYSEPFS